MKPHSIAVVGVLLAVSGCVSRAPSVSPPTALYQKTYNEEGPVGKPLRMTIMEIERSHSTSKLFVEFVSGASVPTSMAIVRASYDIAKARGNQYFINLKEWDDGPRKWYYIIGFADRKEPNPLVYFEVDDPETKNENLEYLSVKEFDRVFRNEVYSETKNEPNKTMETAPVGVTTPAAQEVAPHTSVSRL